MDFVELATTCAPEVHPDTLRRIVHVESSFNPYAIGVVGARLERQPRSHEEAVTTAAALEAKGFNYSIGLAQVNRANFARYGLDLRSGFDVCANLRAGARILQECFQRAARSRDEQPALQAALSCYYSGNFSRGFADGYVARVLAAESRNNSPPPSLRTRDAMRAAPPASTAIPVSGSRGRTPTARANKAAVAGSESAAQSNSALLF